MSQQAPETARPFGLSMWQPSYATFGQLVG
jgi:hypothetical protein